MRGPVPPSPGGGAVSLAGPAGDPEFAPRDRSSTPILPGAAMSTRRPRTVVEEIRQSVPFGSPGQESLVALLRTADEVRRFLGRRLEGEGVTLQQYNVLRILRGAGARGLPTLSIAARMVERQPGVTRLVDRLVAKGLVERQRSAADRRQVLCTISEAGRELLRRLDPVVDEVDEVLDAFLDTEELGTLLGLLDRVRAGLIE
jgi:MarR family transcriptional regulator, organic hydroperoxide resistance regulator